MPTEARCFDLFALYLVLPEGRKEVLKFSPDGADQSMRRSMLSSTMQIGESSIPFICLTLTVEWITPVHIILELCCD